MATIDEILKKYRKALTKKQIEDLIQKSEQYKLLNAGNRANAQTQLAKQYRQTRRGLQNVGLAGREGKLISGREISVKDAYRNAYGTYNQQLQQSENAMIEQAAAKKAAANARARQQQAEQQQKAIEYEQERFNQEQITDPRLEREKPTREDKEYSALVNYNPFNHTADENVNYYLKIAERNGMKGVEANRYAMSMAAEVANRKGAAAEAIQPHGLQPNQEQIQKNLPSLRFAQDYGVNLMKLKQEDPAMAQTIEDDVKYWYDFIDEKSEFWNNAIRNKTKDYHSALQMQANAYAALAKLSLAAKAPAEQRQYYLMSDAEFDTAYDAAERAYIRAEQEYQIAKKDSSGEMDDVISEPKAALEKATQMKNLMDQIKANRASNSTVNLLAYQMQIPESAKTKDKEYASTKEYVDENQNDWKKNEQETDAPGTPTGRLTVKTYLDPTNTRPSWNWSYAREIGWSADDYSKNHDTKGSRYAALINEWSLINGRTAALYGIGQYGDIDSGLSGVFDAIQAIFGANRADTNVDYKWFRDECLMSMRGNYDDTGSSAQKEQMDAMLTLANLMTDEERARFNALLETMGARAADEYFDLLYKTVLPERFSAYVADNNVSEINSLPRGTRWTASGASVPQSISQGIPGIVNAYKTNQQDPVAARVSAMRYNNAQIIRNARMQNFGKFGQFAYSTGMSMADSATVALISGGIGEALAAAGVPTAAVIGGKTVNVAEKAASVIGGSLLGASAYNSTYQEGLERGLTPEKARMTALGSGINEMLFESLSLDMLVGHFQKGGILKVSKNAFVNWIVNTLVQGSVEGSEEVFTDIGNNIWDKMVNGIYSEELTKIREYVSQGMTLEEAKRKVSGEFAAQLGMSFGGGFASGGIMGGGATFMGMVQNRGNEKVGKGLRQNSRVMNELRNFDFKSEYAQEILQQKNLTNADIADLFNIRQQELLGRYKSDIQQAVEDGKITQEQADLLNKYEQNGVQIVKDGKVVDNADGITVDQMPSVQDAIANLDNAARIQFLSNEETRSLVQAVGGETAAVIEQSETADREAERAYRQTVREINNDTTLSPELKQKRLEAAKRTRQNARSEAEKIADTALTNKKGIGAKLETDGNGTVKVGKGSGKVTYDFSTKDNPGHQTVDSMTATEQSVLRIAKIVAASRGDVNVKVEAEFVGEHANENGYYDRSTNTIHINMSGDNSVLWTLSHELTHHLANTDTEAYAALRTAIETALKYSNLKTTELEDRGFEYDLDRVDPYIAREGNLWDALVAFEREEHGYGKDAEEEVVARCCESFLGFDQFVKDFARKQYKSAKAVNKFIAQMNIDMQRVSAEARQSAAQRNVWNDESPENQILRQLTEIDRIANLWRIAVNAEAKKRQAAREETRASTKDSVKRSDAEYLDLAKRYESGDKSVETELRKAVDAAAEAAGYSIKAFHGTTENFNVFSRKQQGTNHNGYLEFGAGFYFTPSETEAEQWVKRGRNGQDGKSPNVMSVYLNPMRMLSADESVPGGAKYLRTWLSQGEAEFIAARTYRFINYLIEDKGFSNVEAQETLKALGYDAIEATFKNGTEGQYVVFDPSQIKSADLITKDDNGNIIPLSERFKTDRTGEDAWKNDDIRYSKMDKVRLSTSDGTRTFTLGDVTAKLYGNDVELDGGKVRQRVSMMEAIAEINGTARVDAASEAEAEAFRRAGAEQVVEELEGHGAKYGTWEFKYEERKFTNDSRYDIKQKQKFAKSILKQVGKSNGFTQAQRVKYGAALGRLMDYLWEMQYGKMDGKVVFELADRLFGSILNDYAALSEADEEFRSELLANMTKTKNAKGSTVYVLEVNDKQMREIKYAYENAVAYASKLSKALGARVTVKQTENAKTLEDIFTNSTDTRIKSDTNEGDMPGELLRLAQETELRKTNPYAAESDERQALKMGMFEAAMAAAGVEKSTAQQIREAVKETRKAERTKSKTEAKKAIDSARLAERMHEGAVRAKERRISENRERALKQHAAEREAKLKQGFRETTQKANETRMKRDMRTIALKWNQRLVKLLANPTEASHVPIQLAREVAELTKTITEYLDSGTERGRINLEKVIKAYQRSFADEETIAKAKAEDPHFDPRGLLPLHYDINGNVIKEDPLLDMMNELNEIVAAKSFKDLSAYEMKALLDIVRGVAKTVYDANRLIGQGERRAIFEVGDSMIHQFEDAPDVKLKGYLETSLDLRRLARIFSGSNDNAEFVKLVERLNEGAIEKERIAQVLQDIFAPVTEKYGDEIRKWYGKKAEWIDTGITQNGKKVEITKGMRVSLAMHVMNAGNMNHIANGGITIPNREMYNKGKMTDAYANGETVQLSAEQIEEIISHMTDAEKAYVEAAKEFFHKRTGYYVNKTSLQLLGYRKATVENYFPIHTDKNFTKTDFASLQIDGSIEGQGFLKERKDYAGNPVYLEDITSVVNRQIRGVALYAGLAVPMRNFNAVMNSTEYFEDENGVWRPRTTVRKAMTQKMGEYGAKVVKGFLEDASEMSHVDVTPMERFAGRLAENYVKAVLLGNAKVALKQIASYPTAAAVIPWKYLGKAFLAGGRNHRLISRADVDLINQYTPLYQLRREGMANEIASIAQKRGLEDKLPWLLKWITKFDVMTVGRLWSAAEYMVADQQNLPVGSDEYYKAVAKVFNDTIQQTQPNFTPLQRNAALRSKNPIVRSLVLFGTQRMQNGGILIEAAMDLKHSKGKSKAEINAAKMKLGRAVASQVVQNILLIVASIGVDALRGRMKGWQDDDKEITPESLAKGMGDMFLSNFIGSFLGGSETYKLISGLFKKAMGETAHDTEFTVPALDAIETLINFAQSDAPDAVKYLLGDHTDEENRKKAISFSYQLAKAFGYATGIPLENAVKDLFKGIIPAINDHVDYFKTGEFPQWWLHQSGKLDSATTAANYKEWTNLGKKGSVYLYWESKYNEIKGDKEQPNADTFASKLMADRDLTPEEKAMLFRMLAGDLENDGAVVYHPITVNQKLKDKERGTIAYDFTNYSRYQMSQMGDAKYNGFLKAVEMGVPEDIAVTAYRNYTSAKRYEKRRGVKADDRFHDWLFKMVSDPAQRAILDMQVVGKAKRVEGTIGYKENGEVYADYSSKEMFNLYTNGKKQDKSDAIISMTDTPEAKAQAFANTDNSYHAKGGIVYNDKDKVIADFTSDEAYRASQMGESHYEKYNDAVKYGMSKENAILAVEKHKEFTNDDDKDNATQYATWVFNTYKNAKDRAIAGAIYTTKPVTVKDGRTYDENGYIYRDYTSAAWYKLSNRTLSKDGVNKRYEAAKLLEKDGYSAEKTVAAYVELDKLSKKTEWQKWLKDNGYTNDQIKIFLWSRGWAK